MDNEKRVYLRVSETPFQSRYGNHVRDSKHGRYSNATELSKYVWELKRNNKVPIITWKIAREVYGNHKLLIIKFANQDILLNKRSEFISKWLIVNMK